MRLYEYGDDERTNLVEVVGILTRDRGTCHVNRGDLRVHFYGVLLSGDLGISIVDLFVDPVLEGLSGEGEDAVSDVGPGQLVDLALHDGEHFHDSLDS